MCHRGLKQDQAFATLGGLVPEADAAERALGQIRPLASEAVQLQLRGPSHEGVVFREQRTAGIARPRQRASLVDEELVAHYATHLLVSGIGDGLLKRDELNTFRDELFK